MSFRFSFSFPRSGALVGTLVLSACGSGAGPTSAPPAIASAKPAASVRFSITWPAIAATRAAHRHPAYVSASTKSLTVSVDGTQVLEADNPAVAGATTKTYELAVAPGPRTFLIALYDETGGTGNLLARSTTMQTISTDAANALAITVDGQLAHIGIVPVPNPYLETSVTGATYTLVGPLAQTFALAPEDADNNIIVSPGVVPPLTLVSGSSGIVATPVTGMDNTYTLSGPVPAAAVTLTASGKDLDGTLVQTTFTAQILAALFVTDPVAHKVVPLDDRGNKLTLAAAAFPDIADTQNCGPRGIAYVAPTGATTTPELYVTRCVGNPAGNNGPGNIGIYDLLGNEIVPTVPMAPSLPQFVTYEPKAGRILVTDSGNDASIEAFALDGTQTFSNAGPHPRPFEQANAASKIAFDPALASPDYLITDGSGYVERYAHDGTFVSKTTAGFTPAGITYDANTKLYYVTTFYSFTPVPTPQTERGTVLAFDANLTLQTTGTANAVAFMGLSTRPADILFDPYNLVLYVTDYAGNKIVTFKEDGTSSTQFPSAVTSVVDPLGLALAP